LTEKIIKINIDYIRYLENIMNSLLEEDKLLHSYRIKGENITYSKLNYFIEKNKLISLFNFSVRCLI